MTAQREKRLHTHIFNLKISNGYEGLFLWGVFPVIAFTRSVYKRLVICKNYALTASMIIYILVFMRI